eukprot:m.147595 g.147595  ORF g.147595 m.147595 type:complete len:1197 (-) comp23157_c0_seq1:132-3722(-)
MSARKSDHIEGEGASRTVGDMLVQTFEVFENQRYFPIKGWSKNLLPTDRAPFSTHDGLVGFGSIEAIKGTQGWIWAPNAEWQLEDHGDKKAAGWAYAVDFVGPMASWGKKTMSSFVRRRRYTRFEHKPAVTASKVDRVAAALAERDVLVGPYGTMAEKLALKATSCVFSTDAAEKRHFDIRFSWCDPERKAGGKVEVIKVGSWNEAGPKTVTLPSAGLDVSPDPANKQDKNCEDAFDVKVVGDQLSVWRVDTQGGWGQQLELHARQASPLQDELQEMYWSVTRTWAHFEWLYSVLSASKRKPTALPKSGAGNFLMNKLGVVSAAAKDGEFLERELPLWLNAMLAKPETREDPHLKLFLLIKNPAELLLLGKKPKSGQPVAVSPGVATACAMITATQTMDIWLRFCFETTMLDLCTGSSVGKAKLDRTAKTRTRRANEAARAQQIAQMRSQLAIRPPGNEERTRAHNDRHERENGRLQLQQSTRFVIAIDRHEDETRLHNDQTAAQAARAEFDHDRAALAAFEQQVAFETAEWHAAVQAVKSEKTQFQNGVHVWVLNSMKTEIMPPFEALDQGVVPPAISPHVDGCPTLPHTVDVFASAGSKLGLQRGKMGAFVDESVDTVELAAEKQQHDAEMGAVFPELHTSLDAEASRWSVEDAAFGAEAEVRVAERAIYTEKVTAQEGPLLAVLSSQEARLNDERGHLSRSPARGDRRKYHIDTATQMMAEGVKRHPTRQARNQHRDQIYGAASQRQQTQMSTSERLFFLDDIAPVPVPTEAGSYAGDRELLAAMQGVNSADMIDLTNGRKLCKDYARDKLGAIDTVTAWRRYEAEVMAAQAPEPVDHFDRDFLRRLANHASRFDAENAQEDTELNNMTTTLTREHGEIGDSPVVTAKLAEEQVQLDAEAPYDADEHARNKAIADAIGAERASRGAKEAALASEIQRVRGIVSDLRPRIDGAYSTFSEAVSHGDVQLFLALEKPSWMGGLNGRLDEVLRRTINECDELTQNSHKRKRKLGGGGGGGGGGGHGHGHGGGHGGGPGSLSRGRDELKRMRKTVREVRAQLEKSKRGEQKLRQAVSTAENVHRQVMSGIRECPIYTSPPGHPADSWLMQHMGAQQQYAAEHQGVEQVAAQLQSQLSSYSISSIIGGLAKFFEGGNRLVGEVHDATHRLEKALDEEHHKAEEHRRQEEARRQQQQQQQ